MFLKVLGVLLLAALSDAQQCLYPCILQNGCVCNHSAVSVGSDGQNYGTCESCSIGWTGVDCSNDISPCVNGGTFQSDGTCSCVHSWTGPHCGDQQCLHSVGGTGPESIVPVNSENQCDKCEAGWNGIACEMCTMDSQCSAGEICYTDTNFHDGYRKVLECEMTDLLWLILLSGGRFGVTSKVKMQCENHLSSCYISVWRMEPDQEWFDPFFYCSLTECTNTDTLGIVNTTVTPMSTFATPVRNVVDGVLGFLLVLLQIVSLLRIRSQVKSRLFVVLGLVICVVLAGLITFSVLYAHDQLTVTFVNQTTAAYNCKHANCTCAKNPPNGLYTPQCSNSQLGTVYLSKLTGWSQVACNTVTNECTLSQEQLGGALMHFQCNASECANETAPAIEYSIGDDSSTIDVALGVAGGVAGLVFLSYAVSWLWKRHLILRFTLQFESPETSCVSSPAVPDSPLNNAEICTLIPTPQRLSSFREAVQRTTLHVNVDNLQYSVRTRSEPVLKSATFDFLSGEMIAIIGPSGAGKTTLLDILARREKEGTVLGEISVNGIPLTASNASDYRRISGYVAQQDILVPTLTVWETIYFAAKLKLPATFDDRLIQDIVNDAIKTLHLTSCADTLVGDESRRGISGGERRRVSIATELVANPRILFLDEPTSGLDSVSAVDVMKAVVNLTKRPPQNKFASFFNFQPAVVFSIHQPSIEICEMFDRVILVSRGHILYSGVASTGVGHLRTLLQSFGWTPKTQARERSCAEDLLEFQHSVPEDVLSAWAAAIVNDRSHLRALAVHDDVMSAARESLQYYPKTWDQISVLSRRTWASLLGSNYLLTSHAAATLFLSLTLSFLYNQEQLTLAGTEDKAGMMTFLLLVIAFSSLSSLDLFISEKKLFCSERENGYYSTGAYFIVKVIFDFIPLRIVPTLLLSSAIYYPMGLRIDGCSHYLWFLFVTTVFSLFVTGICFCVAIIAPSFGTAALVSALIILWHTVFGGLMIQSASIPIGLRYFKYLSPFYFGYESLMVNELEGQQCVFDPANNEGSLTEWSVPIACQQFLFNLGLDPRNFNQDVGLLCGWTAFNLLFGFFLLSLVRIKH